MAELACALQIATNKRYAAASGQGFTVSEVAASVEADFGKIDIIVHSLANGPEVTKPLLETSRKARIPHHLQLLYPVHK
jgi:enoyl-[acyl-carrier protein] reductase I